MWLSTSPKFMRGKKHVRSWLICAVLNPCNTESVYMLCVGLDALSMTIMKLFNSYSTSARWIYKQ